MLPYFTLLYILPYFTLLYSALLILYVYLCDVDFLGTKSG